MRVGFIGLGAMGAPMARNLLRAGHALTVYNRSSERALPLQAEGASVSPTPSRVAAGAEVVCTCVATPQALREVLTGAVGAVGAAAPKTVFIDFSTVDPATGRSMAAACRERGACYLEAPVSGGVAGAVNGTLTVMVGGAEEDYRRALPVIEAVGSTHRRVGEVGAASTIKLVNQLLVAANLAAAVEALAVAVEAGGDPEVCIDIIRRSSGASASLEGPIRNVLDRRFEPGFRIQLLLKDLDLALAMARESGSETSMGEAARRLFEAAEADGLGASDIAAVARPLERRRGLTLGASRDGAKATAPDGRGKEE